MERLLLITKNRHLKLTILVLSYVWSKGFPGGSAVKNPPANAGDMRSIPGSQRFPWRRKWQSNPVFLPGKSHGQKSLAGYSPPGKKRVGHDLATKATATATYGVVWHFSLHMHLSSLEASISKAQNASCFIFSILNYPQVGDSSD